MQMITTVKERIAGTVIAAFAPEPSEEDNSDDFAAAIESTGSKSPKTTQRDNGDAEPCSLKMAPSFRRCSKQ